MDVNIKAIWLVEEAREMTVTLSRRDGSTLLAVVKIDRMTEWIPPGGRSEIRAFKFSTGPTEPGKAQEP